MKTSQKNVRLTRDVLPLHYDLELAPNLTNSTFEGKETILLSLTKQTRNITLHATELKIQEAQAAGMAAKITYDEKAETATFSFERPIPAGKMELQVSFSGVLNDQMHGFYRSQYEYKGKTHTIATTQFESTDARRAFPCFDEPAMKAAFDVTLTIPKELGAISNTDPVETTASGKGLKRIRFAPTPLMPTYLLAFIVGEFEHVQKRSTGGVAVRVWTTPGKKGQAAFALDCATKIIDFFATYFAIPYPLPTLDLIAIPDFAAGAMENWGAITFRETALLVDPKHSSTMNKEWVALVVAHEIAHQWFGNLVTMEWWTHLWLNEGFASYMEYVAVDKLFPKWEMWTQFVESDFGHALHADSLMHTHPIEVEVHHPAEITAVFDAVSYSKGASVIRMLADYLGETQFRDGLRHYLKKHAYGNASTVDLWRALEHVSGKPVAKIMANWTGKPGYPLLHIAQKGKHLEISQKRYFSSPLSAKKSGDSTVWSVPLLITASGKELKPMLLSKRIMRLRAPGQWIKLNSNESSFHRTSYAPELQQVLMQAVSKKQLGARDRLGLVRDAFALAENGVRPTTAALELIEGYSSESEYVVWSELTSGLSKIQSLISHETYKPDFDRFALARYSHIAKKFTWSTKPKTHSGALLKVLVLDSLVRFGNQPTIDEARKLFAKVTVRSNAIPADLRGVVYHAVARYGKAAEHAKLLQLYKAESLHEEKNRLGRALGQFLDPALLQKTLEFALSDHVRSQDCTRMIGIVMMNPVGREIAWKFVKKNWATMKKRFDGSRDMAHLIEPMAGSTLLSDARDVRSFMKAHPTPGTERTVQQVLERIESNAAWLKRDGKLVRNYLREERP